MCCLFNFSVDFYQTLSSFDSSSDEDDTQVASQFNESDLESSTDSQIVTTSLSPKFMVVKL